MGAGIAYLGSKSLPSWLTQDQSYPTGCHIRTCCSDLFGASFWEDNDAITGTTSEANEGRVIRCSSMKQQSSGFGLRGERIGNSSQAGLHDLNSFAVDLLQADTLDK